jgi:hypothetical protein
MTKNAMEAAYDLSDLRKRRTNARHYLRDLSIGRGDMLKP